MTRASPILFLSPPPYDDVQVIRTSSAVALKPDCPDEKISIAFHSRFATLTFSLKASLPSRNTFTTARIHPTYLTTIFSYQGPMSEDSDEQLSDPSYDNFITYSDFFSRYGSEFDHSQANLTSLSERTRTYFDINQVIGCNINDLTSLLQNVRIDLKLLKSGGTGFDNSVNAAMTKSEGSEYSEEAECFIRGKRAYYDSEWEDTHDALTYLKKSLEGQLEMAFRRIKAQRESRGNRGLCRSRGSRRSKESGRSRGPGRSGQSGRPRGSRKSRRSKRCR